MAKIKLVFLSFLVIAILSLAYLFFQIKNQANQKTILLRQQINTWEEIGKNKPDYRDAWLQLAKLHYEQQEINLAKFYVNKALELDPNYEVAQEFKQRLP